MDTRTRTGSVGEATPPGKRPSIELTFFPSVDLITVVRRFVADFFRHVTDDEDVASRLALATHELLENAAKYSVDGAAALRLEVDPATGAVDIETSNRASAPQVEVLRARFEEIASASDASALYAAMLRRSAVQVGGSGGLGLARIWAEGEMHVRLVVDGDRVQIHARGSIAPPG